jgi:cytochrome c-type biogenesis protein CcmE
MGGNNPVAVAPSFQTAKNGKEIMNNRNALLLAVIALGTIITVKYMVKSVVPYISFSEAKSKTGYVQIMGTFDKKSGIQKENKETLFILNDASGSIKVSYTEQKIPDITGADKIAVMGTFDKDKNIFIADKVLTKCPSKYQKKE